MFEEVPTDDEYDEGDDDPFGDGGGDDDDPFGDGGGDDDDPFGDGGGDDDDPFGDGGGDDDDPFGDGGGDDGRFVYISLSTFFLNNNAETSQMKMMNWTTRPDNQRVRGGYG